MFDGQEIFLGLQSGSYQVVVIDVENCIVVGEVMILVFFELQFGVIVIYLVCFGDSSGEVIIDLVFGGIFFYSMDFNGLIYNMGNIFLYIFSG